MDVARIPAQHEAAGFKEPVASHDAYVIWQEPDLTVFMGSHRLEDP